MRIAVGGFGLQGLASIPLSKVLSRLSVKVETITSGIAGFYLILRENVGEEKAIERTFAFINKFMEDLWIADRAGICEGERLRDWKRKAIRYCMDLSLCNGRRSYEEVEEFLSDLKGMGNIHVEYLDLNEYRVKLYNGDPAEGIKIAISFPGIFPPYKGYIISTTYLTQIPLEMMTEGEIVIDNLRDTSLCKSVTADEFLSQSAELRALRYAKMLIKLKRLKTVKVRQILWKKFLKDHFYFINDMYSEMEKGLTEVIVS